MPESAKQLDVPTAPSLSQLLCDRILGGGPITFHDWMEAALYDSTRGYYTRPDRKRWGRDGDYRTSPERTDLFAATFARYFDHLYSQLGRPSRFTIVEYGAGDGAFGRVLLSSLRKYFPDLFAVTTYLIVEISADAEARIGPTLSQFGNRVEFLALTDVPRLEEAIIFSNELLDAFPVHRLTMAGGQLRELYVSVNQSGDFVWTTGELSTPRLTSFCRLSELQLREGQIVDANLGIEEWIKNVALKLLRGYVVTVDYGREADALYSFDERPEGTLRAYSRHRFVDNLLESPGDYDLTASIDWTLVKRLGKANGLEMTEFDRLDQFLLRIGLLDEMQRRMEEAASDVEKLHLSTAAREMILPGGMASSFQVLVQQRNIAR